MINGVKNVTTWEIYFIALTTGSKLEVIHFCVILFLGDENFVANNLEGIRVHAGVSYSCIVGFSTQLYGNICLSNLDVD